MESICSKSAIYPSTVLISLLLKETDENWERETDCQTSDWSAWWIPSNTENDQLYINGKKTDEPYLADYIKKFQKDKLQSTYVGKDYTDNGTFFRKLASQAQAFTVDKEGSPVFTIKLLDDEYLLLGDDRIVSKDSRQVGAFKSSQIQGEAKFRIWPILPFKTY